MKSVIGCAAVFLTLATATFADAKGCIKGAVVGGTAAITPGITAFLERRRVA